MHAVGGRALHVIDVRFGFADAQRHVEGEGIAGAAAIAIRRDHGEIAQALKRITQRDDAAGAVAIVIGDEDSHRRAIYSMRPHGGSLSTKRADPDATLFREAMRDVKPIAQHQRALPEKPKPPARAALTAADRKRVLVESLDGFGESDITD